MRAESFQQARARAATRAFQSAGARAKDENGQETEARRHEAAHPGEQRMAITQAAHSRPGQKAIARALFGSADCVSPRSSCALRSRQQSLYYVGRDRTRQLLIEALKLVGELAVVNSQAMKNCGVEVAHVDRIFDDVVTVLVSFAVGNAGADATARHPSGETSRVVIAAVVVLCQTTLAVHCASKFARPDHQGVIKESAAF